MSEFAILARESILKDVLEKQKTDPGYRPVTVPLIPQIRMSRRIAGAITVSDDENAVYDDTIGRIGNWRRRGPSYSLPLRCLYGREVRNLITAGRCISAADDMWDLTRVIPACAVTGEAAGTAAALTDHFADADIAAIQARLRKQSGGRSPDR